VDSVQRHFFGLRAYVRYTTFFALPALTIHLFKNTLAGQFRFAAALTKSSASMSSE
jgi:hypothetical protein